MMTPNDWYCNIGVSHDLDIFMFLFQSLCSSLRVIINKHCRFHEQDDKNLDTPLSRFEENPIESVLKIPFFDGTRPS